jgi:methylphosphotriester-DNA--protein-cysteine methyltransferase
MKTLTKLALAALLVASSLVACSKETSNRPEQTKIAYVASVIREPFHRPGCKWAQRISPENLQTFKMREEAIKAGHRPCKVCRP